MLLRSLERESTELDETLQSTGLTSLTKKRVRYLREAKQDHARRLQALLEPLALDQLEASYEAHMAMRTRLPASQGLASYYNNIHRDWDWGHEENSASLGLVLRALGDDGIGPNALVLGAGAGRLAYDLHQSTEWALTVALDFNPLLGLLAKRLFDGERIELYEFPIAPKTLEDHAVLRTLQAPEATREGLAVVLADALDPPFREASFNAIVTPWLIDVLPEDFSVVCRRVNRLLAPGGRWIIFGSLAFNHANPALRYSFEECAGSICAAGFADPDVNEAVIPYMCSPASRHARRENVVTWCARKLRDTDSPPQHTALPSWLLGGDEPVPLSKSFQTQAASTQIYAFIMSLIDGRRSATDMAGVLVEQGLMTLEEAEPAIRTFLIKMYEDSQRGPGY